MIYVSIMKAKMLKTRPLWVLCCSLTVMLIVIAPFQLPAQGYWELIYSGLYGTLSDLYFVDEYEGWIVDRLWDQVGRIYHTANGGFDWELQDDPTNEGLRTVFFLDSAVGWVGGNDGCIMHTINGGEVWIEQQTPVIYGIEKIFFVDENIGWAVGGDQAPVTHYFILHTQDGGNNWEIQVSGFATVPGIFRNVVFVDSNLGLAGGLPYQVYRTENGGNDWEIIPMDSIHIMYGLSYLGNGVFCGVGHNDGPFNSYLVSVKSVDYGLNWYYTEFDTNLINSTLVDVSFADSLTGLAVGFYGGIVYYTANGGELWQFMEPMLPNSLWSVSFPKPYIGWTNPSYGGMIYRYVDTSITPPFSIEDLIISIEGSFVCLSWPPVEEDIFGNPTTIDHYEIFRDENPYFPIQPEFLIAATTDTTYLDSAVIGINTQYFYKTVAVR